MIPTSVGRGACGGPETGFPEEKKKILFRIAAYGGKNVCASNCINNCSMKGGNASPVRFEKLLENLQDQIQHHIRTHV